MKDHLELTSEHERMAQGLRIVAQASDDAALTSAVVARARVQFVDALQRRAIPRHDVASGRHRAVLLGLAAMTLATGVVTGEFFWRLTQKRAAPAITYQVGGVSGAMGAWQSASPTAPLSLRFSEGTSLLLSANASLRVVRADEHGATVALEHGTLHARVQHGRDTRWAVDAGPYRVRVTGTEFQVDWDPATASFAIALSSGSIHLTGCDLNDTEVAAGQVLRTRCERVAQHDSRSPADDQRALAAENVADRARSPGETVPDVGEIRPEPSAPARHHASSAAVSSSEHADADDTRRAAATTPESSGREPDPASENFDPSRAPEACDASPDAARATLARVLDLGTANTVWSAIQCARRAGASADSEHALRRFRERFANDSRVAAAAFLLGKLAFARQDFADAATWFGACRHEAPAGPLARESAGRTMEAWKLLGDVSRARSVADEYLSEYPDGPHARLARTLLAP